jgi:hypothetical protein
MTSIRHALRYCRFTIDVVLMWVRTSSQPYQKRHGHWLVAQRPSGYLHLAKAGKATKMQAQTNDASVCCIEPDVSITVVIGLGAQSGLHVSPITALLRSIQLPGTCEEILLRDLQCLGVYLTNDQCSLTG